MWARRAALWLSVSGEHNTSMFNDVCPNPYIKRTRPKLNDAQAAEEVRQAVEPLPPADASETELNASKRQNASEKLHYNTTMTDKTTVSHEAKRNQPAQSRASWTGTESNASSLVIAAANKAGMDGIDRKRIDEIILRESGNSLFMQQQRRRDEKVNQKIAELQEMLSKQEKSDPPWRIPLTKALDAEVPGILAQRPTRPTSVVVDMDMFYMACELLSRPELKERPACVGGGMILTSNYKARQYGVRSAMAGWIADKLVQELSHGQEKLIHVPSNFQLYREKSVQMRQALSEYDPQLRAYSLDEAYLDLGPYLVLKLRGKTHDDIVSELQSVFHTRTDEAAEGVEEEDCSMWSASQQELARFSISRCLEVLAIVVDEMRQRVKDRTGGLTCSAGLGPNFLLAKIGSDANKPNGQLLIGSSHEDVIRFLHPLPIRKVSGIGRVTEKTLQAFGIKTVQDLYDQRALVRFLFKPATASFLFRASVGCSSSERSSDEEPAGQKGISRERTFTAGKSWTEILSKLESIGSLLASDMERKDIRAQTITIKVKLHTFDCLSRARTMPRGVYLHLREDIVDNAAKLLHEIRSRYEGTHFSVRLLGIRCSNFQTPEDRRQIQQVIDFPVSKSPTGATKAVIATKFTVVSKRKAKLGPMRLDSFVQRSKPSLNGEWSAVDAGNGMRDTYAHSEEDTLLICPVCQQEMLLSNDELNRHVDACLNSQTFRNVRTETARSMGCPPLKKQKLTDYF